VLLAPAKTPPAIVSLLEQEVQKAIKSPDLREKWDASGIEPLGSSAAEATATLNAETALWADIANRAKLQSTD